MSNDFYGELYNLVCTFTPQNVVFKEFAVANQIWYKNTLCFELGATSTVVKDKDDLHYKLENHNSAAIRHKLDKLWEQFEEAKEKGNQERILKIIGKIPQ